MCRYDKKKNAFNFGTAVTVAISLSVFVFIGYRVGMKRNLGKASDIHTDDATEAVNAVDPIISVDIGGVRDTTVMIGSVLDEIMMEDYIHNYGYDMEIYREDNVMHRGIVWSTARIVGIDGRVAAVIFSLDGFNAGDVSRLMSSIARDHGPMDDSSGAWESLSVDTFIKVKCSGSLRVTYGMKEYRERIENITILL